MTVEINEAFFEELGNSPAVVAMCEQVAEGIAAKARGSAPKDTGDYANSIKVVRAERSGRVAFLVVSDDPAALEIEARTGNLARAAR